MIDFGLVHTRRAVSLFLEECGTNVTESVELITAAGLQRLTNTVRDNREEFTCVWEILYVFLINEVDIDSGYYLYYLFSSLFS